MQFNQTDFEPIGRDHPSNPIWEGYEPDADDEDELGSTPTWFRGKEDYIDIMPLLYRLSVTDLANVRRLQLLMRQDWGPGLPLSPREYRRIREQVPEWIERWIPSPFCNLKQLDICFVTTIQNELELLKQLGYLRSVVREIKGNMDRKKSYVSRSMGTRSAWPTQVFSLRVLSAYEVEEGA